MQKIYTKICKCASSMILPLNSVSFTTKDLINLINCNTKLLKQF